jgi:hypothetical protein
MELKVDRVWDRGDWAITRDGEMVMSATSSSIVDASGLAAVRDGSAIRIDLGSQPEQTLVFHWS